MYVNCTVPPTSTGKAEAFEWRAEVKEVWVIIMHHHAMPLVDAAE